MRPLAINRSTNGVTVIGFRGRNVAARITALARNARKSHRTSARRNQNPAILHYAYSEKSSKFD
jgi:hypothetical protein